MKEFGTNWQKEVESTSDRRNIRDVFKKSLFVFIEQDESQVIEEIYEMYSRKVFLFLLSKTNNEDIAEELTQETFFQAVQCIDRFKGNSSILTWLCGIAKNVWLKDLRKRQEILSTNDHIQEIADEKEVNVQWEQKEILQLIHNMNEPIREVMYLRLVSNLSFAEIGEIIGKTENWTRVTFFRGKQKL